MEKRILFIIFIVAIGVRIIAIHFTRGFNAPLWGDDIDYDRIALNLCCYGEGLTVWRVPLFPLYLTLIYSLFGYSHAIARLSLAIVGAINCILIFVVTKEAFNKRAAYISTIIFMFYPPLVEWNAYLHSETLLTLLLTVSVLYMIRSAHTPSTLNFILSGFFVGLASLTHPSAIILGLLTPVWALLTFKPNYKLALLAILCIFGSTIGTLSPWILRNYLITGKFVPLTPYLGPTLIVTHNPVIATRLQQGSYKEKWEAPNWISPEASGLLTSTESTYVDREWSFRYPAIGKNTKERELQAVELDRFLRSKVVEYVRTHPGTNIKIALHQIPVFFHFYLPKSHKDEKLRLFCLGIYFVVLFLGIMGGIYSFNRRKCLWILYILWIYGILIPLIFYARRRFRIPIELSIVVLSGMIIDKILSRSSKSKYISSKITRLICGTFLWC